MSLSFGYLCRIAFLLLYLCLFFTLLDRASLGHSGAYAHAGKYPTLQYNPEDEKNNQEN